jgi:hypothetical protein
MTDILEIRAALCIAVLLAVTIVFELTAVGVGADEASLPRPEASAATAGQPFAAAGAVEVIFSRPLFQPGRRSQGGEMIVRGDDALPRLTGIVVDRDRRVAVFQPVGEKPRTLKEGDSLGGWTIQTIGHRQVVLQKSGGTMTIEPAKETVGAGSAIGQTPRRGAYPGQMPAPAPMPPGAPMAPGKAARP